MAVLCEWSRIEISIQLPAHPEQVSRIRRKVDAMASDQPITVCAGILSKDASILKKCDDLFEHR